MDSKIVILEAPGSELASRLARSLEEAGRSAVVRSLDATWAEGAVSLRPDGAVVWQGVELQLAAAVLVERPLFPWPQPQRLKELLQDGVPSADRVAAEREARALALSALRWAAESVPVINSPEAAHIAASPATGLDRAAAAGVETHRWQLVSAPEEANGRPVLDAVGRELWHEPSRPEPGEPAIVLEPIPGTVLELCVAGTAVAAFRRYASASTWVGGAPAELVEPPPAAAAAALRAARAAGLAVAGIALDGAAPHRLLWIDAAPDLDRWDRNSEGSVTVALANLLRAARPAAGGTTA